MRNSKLLSIRQLDRKLNSFFTSQIEVPSDGWIRHIRNSLNMTQEQLARKLNISRQGVGKIEEREVNDSLTIETLKEVGKAMDLKLVYAFVPNQGSFEQLIEKKANHLAKKIVLRTNHNMALEDQAVDQERLKESITELTNEIKIEVKRVLWD